MSDNLGEKLLIEATKEVAKETYKDGLQPAIKNIGGVLETVTGFFDKVIFFPMKKLNILFESKLIKMSKELEQRINSIPINDQKEPPINILGPTMEALKYNIDEEELKEMFLNLLTSSMDKRKESLVHPSYVKIIEQMNALDANLFKLFQNVKGFNNAIQPKIKVSDSGMILGLPEYLIDYSIDGYDMFSVSRSFVRLEKLGLITIKFDSWLSGSKPEQLLDRTDIRALLDEQRRIRNRTDLKLESNNHAFHINDFGRAFAKVCL